MSNLLIKPTGLLGPLIASCQLARRQPALLEVLRKSRGQTVLSWGSRYITRDLDGHNCGARKMADSVKALGRKETRSATFDANLNHIGD
ncbi:toxin C-terminal domain-containing protein [Pseudomonas sp. McL0111]|uniref:toxin C-terminal domain-containing protein n=1 Tax=Pseudomonas sp. McL0111 TaxID=3457357 RepID=UPI00403EC32A